MNLFTPRNRKNNITALFMKYGDLLYRVALSRLGNDADAEDVVQDVFVKYMSAPPVFEDENHEKAWFLRSTIHRCIDLVRKQKGKTFVPLEDARHLAAEDDEKVREILSLIEQLPEIYKDVVVLHGLEGFSLEECAKILEISLSAAKMRLSRAREMLKILRKEENDVY
ncbi:MAG: RNA polymerase sigma factor [Clostridia bacterium]|nr:RNA polymerase sigma factor [Clostridia bacterium]